MSEKLKDSDKVLIYENQICLDRLSGYMPAEIAIKNNCEVQEIYNILLSRYQRFLYNHNPVHFGHKTESYLTEKEMLKGYQAPKYKDLSEDEKVIYKSNKKSWKKYS